jgi:hypothetical protein
MTSTRARLLGSGYTLIFFGGPDGHSALSYCQMMNETTPRLVSDYREIHPMDWSHPSEIMTAMAMTGGVVEVDLIETWSEQAWNRLSSGLNALGGKGRGGQSNNDTILDIVRAVEKAPGGIYLSKLIATPEQSPETQPSRRAVIYLGCKIVEVMEGDSNVDVRTMEQAKRVRFAYTHRRYQYNEITRQQDNTNIPNFSNLALRDGPQLHATP